MVGWLLVLWLGSDWSFGWLCKGIIVHKVGELLSEDALHHLVSHAIVPHQSLPGVLGGVVTVVIGTLVWLIGHQRDVLEQVLLEVLVTHVLPECIPCSELQVTVREGTLDHHLTLVIVSLGGLLHHRHRLSGHLGLRNVPPHNLCANGLLHLLMSHPIVSDHG